jgi:hypothetical protein
MHILYFNDNTHTKITEGTVFMDKIYVQYFPLYVAWDIL